MLIPKCTLRMRSDKVKAIILCAGRGTRLRPLTFTSAKQLIPVANKPVILYSIEKIHKAGITDIAMIVNPDNIKDFQEVLGDGHDFGVHLSYIVQKEPKGLAHAVSLTEEFIDGDDFLMYLGDNLIQEDLSKFVDDFRKAHADASILLTPVEDPTRFGIAIMEGEKVTRVVEKPKTPPSNLAIIGVYMFSSKIFEGVKSIKPSWRGELEITDAIQYLIDNNGNVQGHVVYGWWKDTGRPTDLLEANRRVLSEIKTSQVLTQLNDGNYKIEGPVVIEKGVTISNTLIRGPVIIGKGASIINSYVGPYTSIGPNVTIENSEVENSIFMENSTIRDVDVRIDASIVGKNAMISSIKIKPRVHNLVVGDYSTIRLS